MEEKTLKILIFCEVFLTTEVKLWACAERVDDVNDEAMRRRSEGQRAGGHQQGDNVE